MTAFLSTFAIRHFAERPRQSLLVGLASRLDDKNLSQALGSGCRPWQHLAWQKLAKWDEADINGLVERAITADAPELPVVLKAVSHESLPVWDVIIERIAGLMESPRAEVRLAAARIIALKQPLAAIPLLRQADRVVNRDVLRTLCLADDPSLIVPLMTAFGFPKQSPPPTLGFIATPVWLADNHAREPQIVEWLIRNCGYCEDGLCDAEVSREALNLLSSGFSFVTNRMTSEPRMTKIAHRWLRRIRAFVWRLLPDELGLLYDDDKPLDATDPFEIELFLAAVRDSDRSLFIEQKSHPPFDRANAQREPTPACFHASTRHLRRTFVDQPLAQADAWQIAPESRGEFLLDAARVLLEPNEETRTATDLFRRGKWRTSRSGPVGWALLPVRSDHRKTTKESGRAGVPILHVETPTPDERLSPGADSVKNLAAACGLDWNGIADWLADAEAKWSRCLVPIGIEIQIPKVDPDRFAARKNALPLLGIPSPVRPEFGGMIEAAFRPARSFHALVLGPLLLCRLGVITEPQDMALHISLQGELDERIRFLAFPQLFIHPSQRHRNRPDWSMARVMSKGFVHAHDDAEMLPATLTVDEGAKTPNAALTLCPETGGERTRQTRTELRLFRLFAETVNRDEATASRIELTRGYISDLVAVHVLGSIMQSSCPRCCKLFDEYAAHVEQAVRELPPEFEALLNSNYFESTGDPRDEALLSLLPIFHRWTAVRQVVRDRDLAPTLDLQFRTLRHRQVQQVLTHWSEDHGLSTSEIRFSDDGLEMVLPPLPD